MTPAPYHPGPNDPTPEQRLLLMDDTEWECFIEECAKQLQKENVYSQVLRLAGAGDKGRDVCGYTIQPPTEGTWDLYQAKHYFASTLSPSGFAPELAKFLASVHDKAYPRPRTYFLCALKVGASLNDLFLDPASMRSWILEEWRAKKGEFPKFKRPLDVPLEDFILNFPFNIIRRLTAAELLSIHSRNAALHWERFGILDRRGPNPPVPDSPATAEQKYVEALLNVYTESTGNKVPSADAIPAKWKKHFRAQRMLFYCAEGLNRFSRDKLPGAFDDLLDQIELGTSGVVAAIHESGLARLRDTLGMANTLPVTSNPLSARLSAGDLQGGCHHLANQERIEWVGGNDDE